MSERRKAFIEELAKFFVDNQAGKRVALEVESYRLSKPVVEWATEWARLRGVTPVFGYPTHEEAVKILTEFLG